MVALCAGCDTDPDDATDEEKLMRVAEANGFDISNAEYDGENLSIDDVSFGPHHLVEYDALVANDFRAYLKNENTKVISPAFRDICFEIDDDGANEAEDWIGTFNTLAVTYNGLNTSLRFVNRRKSVGCPAGYEEIEVKTKNFSGNTLGKADWPTHNIFNGNTHPGNWIKLDRGSTPNNLVASHELMHALGFVHINSPNLGNYDHVSGTCLSAVGCDTIMFSSGSPSSVVLEDDDIDALETVY